MDGGVLADVVVLAPAALPDRRGYHNGQTKEEAPTRFGDAMG